MEQLTLSFISIPLQTLILIRKTHVISIYFYSHYLFYGAKPKKYGNKKNEMTTDEGYIKYKIVWEEADLPASFEFEELLRTRNTLYASHFIGANADRIGYGNVSERIADTNTFIISGTGTGNLPVIQKKDFSFVTNFDIQKNTLHCTGKVKASSEALTHAAFYSADKTINAVIHVHHFQLWNAILHTISAAAKHIAYGTPEMANEIFRLLKTKKLQEEKILVTAGHREGIFTFGKNMQEAYDVLMHYASANYY